MNDRRQPLGGITKETFVNAQDETLYRGLQYDILSCIDSKIQLHTGEIKKMNDKCPQDCIIGFDKRYVQRFSEKLALSRSELIAYVFIIGSLFGLGYLTVSKIAGMGI